MPRSIARRKTKKAVKKRFKITGTGKMLRSKAGRRHLAGSKSSKRKRLLRQPGKVHDTLLKRVLDTVPFE